MKWEWQIIQHIYKAFRSGDGCTSSIDLDRIKIDHLGNVIYSSVTVDASIFYHGYEATAINSIINLHDRMYAYTVDTYVPKNICRELAMFSPINNYMYASILRSNDVYSNSQLMDMVKVIYEAVAYGIIKDIQETVSK